MDKNPDIFSESNLKDSEIRKKLKENDYVIGKETKEIYDREEKQLNSFFKDLRSPIAEDPTLIRKKRYEEKMSNYKQVLDSLDFKSLIRGFWTYNPHTPEEIETLNLCRKYAKENIFKYMMLGLALTTGTSLFFRRQLTPAFKISSFIFGSVGGSIYGIISSTEYVLRKFEALGPDFALGRLAITEIEEFRMDKKTLRKY